MFTEHCEVKRAEVSEAQAPMFLPSVEGVPFNPVNTTLPVRFRIPPDPSERVHHLLKILI